MKYECPSCNLQWQDKKEPFDNILYQMCPFCALKHTQKELIHWQMDHIEDINPKKFPHLLRHFYRFVDQEIKTLKEKIHVLEDRSIRRDS